MMQGCWYSWVDSLANHASIKLIVGNLITLLWVWPFLGDYFDRKDLTINGWADSIRRPESISDLPNSQWLMLRQVCSIWHAGRVFEQLHLEYRRLQIIGALITISAPMLIAAMIANNEFQISVCDPQGGFTLSYAILVAGYGWIGVCLLWGLRIRGGVEKLVHEVLRELHGK